MASPAAVMASPAAVMAPAMAPAAAVVPLPAESSKLTEAHTLYAQGSYQSAAELCDAVLQEHKEPSAPRVEALLLLGACAHQRGDWTASIEYNKAALSINPQFAEAYSNLGNAVRQLGQPELAIQLYRHAVALKPSFVEAHNNLGSVYAALGRSAEAIEAYRAAATLNPSLTSTHCNLGYSQLGDAYREAGQLDEAIRMYMSAVTLQPDQAEVHSHLASTLKDAGRIPESIVHYKKALQLKPWFPAALCNLVHAYVFTADWREYDVNMKLLEHCLDAQLAAKELPAIQPFHAFVYPMHLEKVKALAVAYAKRAEEVATCLLAYKPAAVQVLYMGFPGTMGADFIDYLVTDNVVSPPGLECVDREKLPRLPLPAHEPRRSHS